MEDKKDQKEETTRQSLPKWEKPSVKEIDITVATGLTINPTGADGSFYS